MSNPALSTSRLGRVITIVLIMLCAVYFIYTKDSGSWLYVEPDLSNTWKFTVAWQYFMGIPVGYDGLLGIILVIGIYEVMYSFFIIMPFLLIWRILDKFYAQKRILYCVGLVIFLPLQIGAIFTPGSIISYVIWQLTA